MLFVVVVLFLKYKFIYLEANYFTILYWFCHTLTWICHGCFPQWTFQNTLELSACPDLWEMWKGFAGILVPFLPVSYHNPPDLGTPTTYVYYSSALGAVSSSVPHRLPSSMSSAPHSVLFSRLLPPASRSITYLWSGPYIYSFISSALPPSPPVY